MFKPSPPLKLFGSGVFAIASLRSSVQSESLRIVGRRRYMCAMFRPGNDGLPGRVHRCACLPRRPVAAARHVPEYSLPRLLCTPGDSQSGFRMREPLKIEKEESLVPPDRAADAAAIDVLHELPFAEIVEIRRPFVGIQAWRAIKPESVPVKLVCAGLGDEQNVRAAVATDIRRRDCS